MHNKFIYSVGINMQIKTIVISFAIILIFIINSSALTLNNATGEGIKLIIPSIPTFANESNCTCHLNVTPNYTPYSSAIGELKNTINTYDDFGTNSVYNFYSYITFHNTMDFGYQEMDNTNLFSGKLGTDFNANNKSFNSVNCINFNDSTSQCSKAITTMNYTNIALTNQTNNFIGSQNIQGNLSVTNDTNIGNNCIIGKNASIGQDLKINGAFSDAYISALVSTCKDVIRVRSAVDNSSIFYMDCYGQWYVQHGMSISALNGLAGGTYVLDVTGVYGGHLMFRVRGNSNQWVDLVDVYNNGQGIGQYFQIMANGSVNMNCINCTQNTANLNVNISSKFYANLTNFTQNVYIGGNLSVKRPYSMYSSTENQTIASANIAYPITFNYTEDAYLINKASDLSNFSVQQTGKYLVEISIIAQGNQGDRVQIWLQKNGINIDRSNTIYDFKGTGANAVIAVPFIISLNLTDNFRVMYSGSATTIKLPYYTNTSYSPATPSAIMTITKISELT